MKKLIFLNILIAIAVNVDSIKLTRDLYHNQVLSSQLLTMPAQDVLGIHTAPPPVPTVPEAGMANREMMALRGKVLGGSSSINMTGFSRGNPGDFDRWARNGATGWSWNEVLPYFKRLETWEGGETALRGGSGPLHIKSAKITDPLTKAVDASVDAQFAAMKMMRPGLYEYQIAARMKEVHEMAGCSREAYSPIVGAGLYSTNLHYDALNNEIKDGDVVVIDVAGEYGGYAADITRTLPANGKFTARQREIYEIVLGAQNAALAAIKPGAMLYGGPKSVHQVAYDYINTHGHDLHGNTLGRYFFHGVGHHLGLDVHDPNDRTSPLQPNMVITDEPGIYIPEEKIGVRIEDDVLVTADGNQLLTAKLPRSPDEIEKIMAEARANPQPQP